LAIGQSFQGGIIFYLDGSGEHGLISAASDQTNSAPWGCPGTFIGATSTAIGTGQANTTAIVNGCSDAGTAARICYELVLNGYDDWFLPSKDELNQMGLQRNVIGNFITNYYRSSTETNANTACLQWFGGGLEQYCSFNKTNAYSVRAIRAF
jgi:hypothetical protein